MPVQHKHARTARPQTLGERMAARRQREADAAANVQEEEEDEDELDQSMSLLPEGLHNALSEMSKAFAQTPATGPPHTLPGPQHSRSHSVTPLPCKGLADARNTPPSAPTRSSHTPPSHTRITPALSTLAGAAETHCVLSKAQNTPPASYARATVVRGTSATLAQQKEKPETMVEDTLDAVNNEHEQLLLSQHAGVACDAELTEVKGGGVQRASGFDEGGEDSVGEGRSVSGTGGGKMRQLMQPTQFMQPTSHAVSPVFSLFLCVCVLFFRRCVLWVVVCCRHASFYQHPVFPPDAFPFSSQLSLCLLGAEYRGYTLGKACV